MVFPARWLWSLIYNKKWLKQESTTSGNRFSIELSQLDQNIHKKINAFKDFSAVTKMMLHQWHCVCKHWARRSQFMFFRILAHHWTKLISYFTRPSKCCDTNWLVHGWYLNRCPNFTLITHQRAINIFILQRLMQ